LWPRRVAEYAKHYEGGWDCAARDRNVYIDAAAAALDLHFDFNIWEGVCEACRAIMSSCTNMNYRRKELSAVWLQLKAQLPSDMVLCVPKCEV
jgi:hypothetical protein